jgi:hypothetical protein
MRRGRPREGRPAGAGSTLSATSTVSLKLLLTYPAIAPDRWSTCCWVLDPSKRVSVCR